jgi:hypothetical protein
MVAAPYVTLGALVIVVPRYFKTHDDVIADE